MFVKPDIYALRQLSSGTNLSSPDCNVLLFNITSDQTVNLPPLDGVILGFWYLFKREDMSGANLVIQAANGDNIDGGANVTLASQKGIVLVATPANTWITVQKIFEPGGVVGADAGFSVTASGDQTANGVLVLANWSTANFWAFNDGSLNLSSGIFSCSTAGKYQVTLQVGLQNNVLPTSPQVYLLHLALQRGGVTQRQTAHWEVDMGGQQIQSFTISNSWQLQNGDQVWAEVETTQSTTVLGALSNFSIQLLHSS